MRELQLWGDPEDVDSTFADIARLAESCQFGGCSHEKEPGCAVQMALESGALEERRYVHYLKLKKEMDFLRRRQDKNSERNERERWKKIAKYQKEVTKERRNR